MAVDGGTVKLLVVGPTACGKTSIADFVADFDQSLTKQAYEPTVALRCVWRQPRRSCGAVGARFAAPAPLTTRQRACIRAVCPYFRARVAHLPVCRRCDVALLLGCHCNRRCAVCVQCARVQLWPSAR
jgi:hypothetical protein